MTVSNQNPCNKGNNLLLDCRREINSRKIIKIGDSKAAITAREEKEVNRNHKVCCLLKARDSNDFYNSLNLYIAIDANCKATEIEKKVVVLTDKGNELVKALKGISDCLEIVKSKAGELKNKACDIQTQVNDKCNTKQLKILEDHFKNDHCFDSEGKFGNADLSSFEKITEYIVTSTKSILSNSDTAYQSSRKIKGIQTFSDVAALKERTKAVGKCLIDFKKDIDNNLSSTENSYNEAKKEINECVKEVALKTMIEHTVTSCYEGLAATLDFACNKSPCDPYPTTTIDEICKKVTERACNPKSGSDPCVELKMPPAHA